MHKVIHRLLIIFIVAGTVVTAGCGSQKVSKEQPVYVRTQTISTGDVDMSDEYPGQVKSKYENALAFQVSGRIAKRFVNVGDTVKKGQSIMLLDTSDLSQNTVKAQQQVQSAKAQLDLASANLSRYQKLYAQEAISAAALDSYETSYKSAKAAYEQAQAQERLAQNSLAYATLRANADGVITAVSGETGQVVSAGQSVATLAQADGLDVVVNVPENKIDAFKVGERAKVSFWALPKEQVLGKIWTISPAADPNTRTYEVRIALDSVPDKVHLGMTANVFFAAGKGAPDEALLPLSAFYQTGDKPQIWVIEDGKAHLKDVSVKSFSQNDAVVEGLPEGTIVITAGVDKLSEGEKVAPADGGAL